MKSGAPGSAGEREYERHLNQLTDLPAVHLRRSEPHPLERVSHRILEERIVRQRESYGCRLDAATLADDEERDHLPFDSRGAESGRVTWRRAPRPQRYL